MNKPFISVIIPTYNRPARLEKCLQALYGQTFEKPWEVIVVDDGSATDLYAVVENKEWVHPIQLIVQENKGPAAARNTGVKHASGEYLAFLDDDCEPEPQWLHHLSGRVRKGVLVGGKTENLVKGNLYSEVSQALVAYLYESFKGTPWYFYTSNNFLVDKLTFLEVGGFDESFPTSAGEDREFCARWRNLGFKMHYASEAVIGHAHEMSFVTFWKLHFKYGGAASHLMRKLQEMGIQPLKPNLTFYMSLFSFVGNRTELSLIQKVQSNSLLMISQMAAFLGWSLSKYKKKD